MTGRTVLRLVGCQVVHGHDAAHAGNGVGNRLRHRAAIEHVARLLQTLDSRKGVAVAGAGQHRPQGVGQARLHQRRASGRNLAVVVEHAPSAGLVQVELLGRRLRVQPVQHILVVGYAIGCVGDGRGQQLVNGLGAVPLRQRKEGVNDTPGSVNDRCDCRYARGRWRCAPTPATCRSRQWPCRARYPAR